MDPHDWSSKTDHELVAITLQHQQAFRFLIERYEAKLLRYIQRISNVSLQEAEDIVQETFINAYTHLADVDPKISFSAWMYRIAHNQTISAYRKRKARPEGNMLWDVEDDVIERIAADDDIKQEMDRRLLREQLQSIMEKMDLKYREMIELRFFQDKSYDEIADIIRKPPGTVATLVHRAKAQMKKHLKNRPI